MSPLACSSRVLRRGLRTYLVNPAVVCSQSRILGRGDDLSAPRAHLAGAMRLVVFRIVVRQFLIFVAVLLHYPLGCVFATLHGVPFVAVRGVIVIVPLLWSGTAGDPCHSE